MKRISSILILVLFIITQPVYASFEPTIYYIGSSEGKSFETLSDTKTLNIKLLANYIDWPTLDGQINQIKDWFYTHSDGKLILDFDLEYTHYEAIPFTSKGLISDPSLTGIDGDWYDINITPKGIGYDLIIFLMPTKDWKEPKAAAWRNDRDDGPIEIEIRADENELSNSQGFHVPAFTDFARHEITHSVFMLTDQPDYTHEYWDEKKFDSVLEKVDFTKFK